MIRSSYSPMSYPATHTVDGADRESITHGQETNPCRVRRRARGAGRARGARAIHDGLDREHLRDHRVARRQQRAIDVGLARRRDLYGILLGRKRRRRRDLSERQDPRLDRHARRIPGWRDHRQRDVDLRGDAVQHPAGQRHGRPLQPRDAAARSHDPGQRVERGQPSRRDHRPRDRGHAAVRERLLRQPRARVHHRRRLAARHRHREPRRARARRCRQSVGRAEECGEDRRIRPHRRADEHDPDGERVAAGFAVLRCVEAATDDRRSRARHEHQALRDRGHAEAGRHVRRAGRLSRHDDGHQGPSRRPALHARGRHRQGCRRHAVRAQQSVGRRLGPRAQRRDRHSRVRRARQRAVEAAGAELRGDRRAGPDDRRRAVLQRHERLFRHRGRHLRREHGRSVHVPVRSTSRHERLSARPAFRPARERRRPQDSRRVGAESGQLQFLSLQRGERLHRDSRCVAAGQGVQHIAAGDGRLFDRQQGRRVGGPQWNERDLALSARGNRCERQAIMGRAHLDPDAGERPADHAHSLPVGQRYDDPRAGHRGKLGLDRDERPDRGVSRLERGQRHAAEPGDRAHEPQSEIDRVGRQLSVRRVRAYGAEHRRVRSQHGPARRHADQFEHGHDGRGQRRRFDVRPEGVSALDRRIRDHEGQLQRIEHRRLSLAAVTAARASVRKRAAPGGRA
ncbi:LigA [Burkholderia pseudomallei 1710b]|uniref:LigA n=1 Tax=Burkholderia pseudomallei (strain 1710b) TaxID=320372 RepID=Q3JHX0_BURP1|nr:LigA [Burkholderia pseudomallei 1710b]